MNDQAGAPQRPSGPHRWLSALPVAAAFLTRLPVRGGDANVAGATVAFPVVGALVGTLGGGAYGVGWLAGLPALACAFLAVGATVAVTGALHEDGLADAADGLAGQTPDAAIRIMRDSRTGGYGVLALVFSVGLRVSAVAALGGPVAVILAMAATGAASRAAMPAVMRLLPPASMTGLAAAAGRPDRLDVFLAAAIAVFLALVCLGPVVTLAATGGVCLAAGATAALARRRLGGYTGDVLGAVQQASEIAALLAVAAAI